jgi:hypothetical protein
MVSPLPGEIFVNQTIILLSLVFLPPKFSGIKMTVVEVF